MGKASRASANYGPPLCGACGAKTRPMLKSKWKTCENGHRLYKVKAK